MTAAPDWYPDPGTRAFLRWWDGIQWTPYTQPFPMAPPPAQARPMAPPPVPVPQPAPQPQPVKAQEGWWGRRQDVAAASRRMQLDLGISSWEAAKRQVAAKKAERAGGVVAERPPVRPTKEVAKRVPSRPAREAVEPRSRPARVVAQKVPPRRSTPAVSPEHLRVVNRWPLEEQIEVAGETYHIKAIKTVLKQAGKTVTARGVTLDDVPTYLCPEPSNEFDRNAVLVMVGIYSVGYLPAEIAVDYSPALLKLARRGEAVGCQSRIWARLEGGMARARVTVLAPEAEELQ